MSVKVKHFRIIYATVGLSSALYSLVIHSIRDRLPSGRFSRVDSCCVCIACYAGIAGYGVLRRKNEFGRSKLVVPRLTQVASSCLSGSE